MAIVYGENENLFLTESAHKGRTRLTESTLLPIFFPVESIATYLFLAYFNILASKP